MESAIRLKSNRTAAGYRLTAEYMISAVHDVVSENLRDLDDVTFSGTGYYELFEKKHFYNTK